MGMVREGKRNPWTGMDGNMYDLTLQGMHSRIHDTWTALVLLRYPFSERHISRGITSYRLRIKSPKNNSPRRSSPLRNRLTALTKEYPRRLLQLILNRVLVPYPSR
jgi:hypothetical protein